MIELVTIAAAAVTLAACADDGGDRYRVYLVQSGDTLGHVAERFGVGSGAIVRLNDIENPNLIRAGTGLKLPDTDATADLPLYRPRRHRAEPPTACDVTRLGEDSTYERVERWGCWTTDCLAVDDERRVCKCASDGGGRVFVETDGGGALGWPGAGFMGDTRLFEVVTGDLDRDGVDELVVASHRVTSNGMAVMTWNLAILDGGDTTRPPLTFTVEGYGEHTFGADRETGACDVFGTEWLDADDQLLGVGHYFAARAFAFDGGALLPRAAPVVAERMHADAQPELRDADPFVPAAVDTVQWGTIARAHREPGEYHAFGLVLDVDLAGGSRAAFRPGGTYSVDTAHTFARLGDAATGRVFPEAYVPADIASFEGRRVRIDGFDDAGSDLQWHVIWLL